MPFFYNIFSQLVGQATNYFQDISSNTLSRGDFERILKITGLLNPGSVDRPLKPELSE